MLFAVQAWLVQIRSVRHHRRVGWFGAAVAATIVPSGVYVWAGTAMFAVHLVELTASGCHLWLTLGRWCLG